MQQNASALAKSFARKVLNPARSQIQAVSSPCGVFISHRGIDTRRNLAGLLHDHLARLRLGPFLDCRNMKPGDRLYDKIDAAIRDCNLGIALFSPRYCDSYFCLRELASLMESNKRVIPIFCDVKPSQLRVKNSVTSSEKELQRFSWALEEAKYTVGLSFDSLRGNWSEFLESASDAVIKNLLEIDHDLLEKSLKEHMLKHNSLCLPQRVHREIDTYKKILGLNDQLYGSKLE